MFTGLVQKVGALGGIYSRSGGAVIAVKASKWEEPLVLGESVAVQGCCLTVVAASADGSFEADVLSETLKVTALSALKPGAAVNLERAMRPMDRFGGHIVQGHVDATAQLVHIGRVGRDYLLRLRCPAEEFRYIVYKGSVALDGVSLTVSAVPADMCFEVNIIPTTWAETSLSERRVGDMVNLETDVVGRYVEKFIATPSRATGSVTMDLLQKAGFAK